MNVENIRKGYKIVKFLFGEYYEMPDSWQIKTFGELFEFLKTGTNSRDDLSEDGDVHYIHYGDIHVKWHGLLDCNTEKIPFVDKTKIRDLPFLKDGDLIIADASEDHEGSGSSILLKNIKNRRIVSGLHTIALRNTDGNVYPEFARYLTSIKFVKRQIVAYVTGISVFGLSKNNLKKIRTPLPTMAEQQKIASLLSNVDSLINQTQKIIEQTQRLRKGLMQQLLTKGIGHTKFKKVSWYFGKDIEIPEDWEIKYLNEIAEVKGRVGWKGYTQEDFVEKGQGAISLGANNISKENRLDLTELTYVTWLKYDESPEIQVSKSNIILAQRGSIGKVAIINHELGKTTINPNVVLIKSPKYGSDFLYYALISVYVGKQMSSITSSTTIPLLTQGQINKFKILIPPLNEQQKIASILSNVDSQIYKQQEYKSKLKSLKKGLMQKLLTGQIRVKV